MKERPILFSAPMVRAILDGMKTQTRRVVKPQPPAPRESHRSARPTLEGHRLWEWWSELWKYHSVWCPYGAPGDRLWVRETWTTTEIDDPPGTTVVYAADMTEHERGDFKRWHPSIHMRRVDSRITLEVTDISAERLHDITAEEAIAEGVEATEFAGFPAPVAFKYLWENINGHESWDANPWVWVIAFKRVFKRVEP